MAAGWGPGGSFGRILGRWKERNMVVVGIGAGYCSLRRTVAAAAGSLVADVAVADGEEGNCLLADLAGCIRHRHTVEVGGHGDIVGKLVHLIHSRTEVGCDSHRCRTKAAGSLAEAAGCSLVGRKTRIGRIEEVLDCTKEAVAGSSPDLRSSRSHSCCRLLLIGLGVGIWSCSIFSSGTEFWFWCPYGVA